MTSEEDMLSGKMKERQWMLFVVILISVVMTVLLFVWEREAAADWIYYDDGVPAHAGSDFQYQGVRFSLPEDVLEAPLLTISFYYNCNGAGSCPVTLHITGSDHMAHLVEPIDYTAIDGWNTLDISDLNLTAPHNFYIILESHECGYPLMDDEPSAERSFKGRFLQSLNTRLSYNLLVWTEVGPPLSIPLLKQWKVYVKEKVKVKIKPHSETIKNEYSERWALYPDGSFETEDYIYGMSKQKGKKYAVFLDPEDIRNEIWGMMEDISFDEIADVIVTKITFTWTERKDGSIKGKYTAYAGINFQNSGLATVIVNRTFKGTPDM
jgi:hypothetical protein